MRWTSLALLLVLGAGCNRNFSAPKAQTTAAPLRAAAVVSSVAPHGQTAITVSGGTPPYSLALADNPGDPGAALDGSSNFHAGDGDRGTFASTVDTVHVIDSANVTIDVAISVGPPLQLFPKDDPAAPTTSVPGGSLTFIATGGQAPYTFSLAPNGNTSWGAMSASGIYVAGANLYTVDTARVVDANGVEQRSKVSVIGPRLDADSPSVSVAVGDFNGDGVQDLLINDSAYDGVIRLAIGGVGKPVVTQTMRFSQFAGVLIGDFDGDRRDDALITSGGVSTIYHGRRDGTLEAGPNFSYQLGNAGLFLFSGPVLTTIDLRPALDRVALVGIIADGFLPGTVTGTELGVLVEHDGGGLAAGPLGETPFDVLGTVTSTSVFLGFPTVNSLDGQVFALDGFGESLWIHGYDVDGGVPSPALVTPIPANALNLISTLGGLYDFNQDGLPDLGAVFAQTGNPFALEYILGEPDGGFADPLVVHPGTHFILTEPPDLSQARAQVVGVGDDGGFAISAADDGGLTFSPLDLPAEASNLIAGDFNGDGHTDLVEITADGSLFFLPADAVDHYRTGRVFQSEPRNAQLFESLAVGDLNGDGRSDLLAANFGATVLTGTPSGALSLDAYPVPGEDILAVTVVPEGGLVASVTPDGLYYFDRVFLAPDAGWGVARTPIPVSFASLGLTRMSAGGSVPGGDVLVGFAASPGLPWAVVQYAPGHGAESEDFTLIPLLQFPGNALWPVSYSGSTVDDLVYQDTNTGAIELFAAGTGATLSWPSTATSTLDSHLFSPDGGSIVLKSTFAARAGGRADSVLVESLPNELMYDPSTGGLRQLITGLAGSPDVIVVGDFDGDGLNDVAWLDNTGRAHLGLQTADGGAFVDVPQAARFKFNPALAAGDIDGDGRCDLVALDASRGELSVYLSEQLPDGGIGLR